MIISAIIPVWKSGTVIWTFTVNNKKATVVHPDLNHTRYAVDYYKTGLWQMTWKRQTNKETFQRAAVTLSSQLLPKHKVVVWESRNNPDSCWELRPCRCGSWATIVHSNYNRLCTQRLRQTLQEEREDRGEGEGMLEEQKINHRNEVEHFVVIFVLMFSCDFECNEKLLKINLPLGVQLPVFVCFTRKIGWTFNMTVCCHQEN